MKILPETLPLKIQCGENLATWKHVLEKNKSDGIQTQNVQIKRVETQDKTKVSLSNILNVSNITFRLRQQLLHLFQRAPLCKG